MGCDLINEGGKTMKITIRDYDTNMAIYEAQIDIEGHKRISYEIYGDNVKER